MTLALFAAALLGQLPVSTSFDSVSTPDRFTVISNGGLFTNGSSAGVRNNAGEFQMNGASGNMGPFLTLQPAGAATALGSYPAIYLRVWLYVQTPTSFTTNDHVNLAHVYQPPGNGTALFGIGAASGGFNLGWENGSSFFVGPQILPYDQWHLVEVEYLVDSKKITVLGDRRDPIVGTYVKDAGTSFQVGLCWNSNRTFNGRVLFDELKLAASPLPSQLKFRNAPASVTSSQCFAVQVDAVSPFQDGGAMAIEAAPLVLKAGSATLTTYSDSTCSAPAPAVIASQASSTTFYVRLDSADLVLNADGEVSLNVTSQAPQKPGKSDDDFVADSVLVAVRSSGTGGGVGGGVGGGAGGANGGSGGGAGDGGITPVITSLTDGGCHCDAAVGGSWLMGLLAFGAARRAKKRR